MEKRERHFVLVHGACHGAWSWYKVITLLKSAGHKVTALDLAACGIHPKQAHELRSIKDYLEPLMEFLAALPAEERVILVGHSMGGACISVAMERFPNKIYVAVYATALMPGPDLDSVTINEEFNRRLDSFMDTQFTFDQGPNNPPTSCLFGPKCMASKLYQLSPPEICLSFYEAKAKPPYWFSNKIERLYWEQWYINLNVAQHSKAHSSKSHNSKVVVDPGESAVEERIARRAEVEASLREVLFQIIKFVNEKKDHIPPIPTAEGFVYFSHEITIPSSSDSAFGMDIFKRMLQTGHPTMLS